MTTTTVLPFRGGELSSFDPLDNQTIEATVSGTYDPNWARCALHASTVITGARSPLWSPASTFWCHTQVNIGVFTTGAMMYFYSASTIVMQIIVAQISSANQTYRATFYTLQSGVLTSVGSVDGQETVLDYFVMNLVAGASGSFALYVAGTQIFRATGLNHAGFPGVDQIEIRGRDGAGIYWSEVICDTTPHIGSRLKTYPIDTVSATNTGFTGPVTSVNEVVTNDASFVFATADGQISTYYANGFSLSGLTVAGISVGVRGRVGTTGPQNEEVAIRSGGANYVSTSMAGDVGFQAATWSWQNDPATSSPWTPEAAALVEGGQKALT